MASSSYAGILVFLLTTLAYYLYMKPKKTLETPAAENPTYLGIYFLLVLIGQFIVNAAQITSACGGNISQNIGTAFTFTFFPWVLLFGAVIVVLLAFPGFKSAFADVIGYFYVATAANVLLTDLLIHKDVQDKLPDDISQPEKQKLMDAADTIVKIAGNTSILINQMVPANFLDFWNVLRPLMKPEFSDPALLQEKQTALFDLVVTRDNVGECMWYIYAGLLISSVVQLQINRRGCVLSPKQMAQNYQAYLSEQEKIETTNNTATSQDYVIVN
jgi:hypothetical protein